MSLLARALIDHRFTLNLCASIVSTVNMLLPKQWLILTNITTSLISIAASTCTFKSSLSVNALIFSLTYLAQIFICNTSLYLLILKLESKIRLPLIEALISLTVSNTISLFIGIVTDVCIIQDELLNEELIIQEDEENLQKALKSMWKISIQLEQAKQELTFLNNRTTITTNHSLIKLKLHDKILQLETELETARGLYSHLANISLVPPPYPTLDPTILENLTATPIK